MAKQEQKRVRKYSRSKTSKRNSNKSKANSSLSEMFDRFMVFKETEGLTKRTLNDYQVHFKCLLDYTGEDLTKEEINLDLFRGYIGFMLHDKSLSPVTANVRIRTMRAFLRHCYLEGWIEEPIHERFKPVKTQEVILCQENGHIELRFSFEPTALRLLATRPS
jgi:integrase/recombinase XerD